MYKIHLAQNTHRDGRARTGSPQFSVMSEGDYVSFVGSKVKRWGTPGKRIVFCGAKKKKPVLKAQDFSFRMPGGAIERQKTISVSMDDINYYDKYIKNAARKSAAPKSAAPKRKTAAKAKPKAKARPKLKPIYWGAVPRSKSLTVLPKKSRKRPAAKKISVKRKGVPNATPQDLKDFELFVQVNKKIRKRTRDGRLTNQLQQGWTMKKARKAAKQMGFGRNPKTGRLHPITKISGKRRKAKKLAGNVVRISGGKKRRSKKLNKMVKVYGKKRRMNLTRRLRGMTDNKPMLVLGLLAGGGVAYLLKNQWNERHGKMNLPNAFQENPHEVFAVSALLVGIGLTFSDKIGAVKKRPKLATALKASGIGIALGSLILFAKDKFSSSTVEVNPAAMEGLRGRLKGMRSKIGGKVPSLQSSSLGVPALGLKGNVVQFSNSAINAPAKKFGGNVVRLRGNVVQLKGAANLETSVQTGLTEAEFGL